ncbi:MAG TPA: C1 family peptidase [Microbacterium sp.]|uniref:C1 family peptidase n=1 Tax=Microbacterium sp. TaxID=51671 RepID=UPI002B4A371B|nr:C1 family peptidase [Microbacterium sp.]HKT55519.1 C1 family peptidase [Microbacterium sp.]
MAETPSPRLTTYGDVRRLIAQNDLGWQVLPSIPDDTPLVRRLLGGPTAKPADPSRRVDVLKLVADQPSARHLVAATSPGAGAEAGAAEAGAAAGGAGGTRPASVDWRTHNGWPTFTRTRDQFDSEHCWIFAPTGIIEAMTRIEHCVWAPRSEGDVVKGLSVVVGQCGDSVNTLNWAKNNGQADPGCIPWPFPAARNDGYWIPGPTNCGTGSTQHTTATTTFDRSGRTVKVPAFTTLSNTDDMKNWIWAVGPTVASSITIYDDFYGYSDISTVYRAAPNQSSNGTHVVDVVGYDDGKQAWLIRNSWGGTPGGDDWGDHGYGWIGYGQIGIDSNPMYGLRGMNPDPWSKRFNHNGAMFESGDGANHDNFELFVHDPGGGIAHWWRDNGNGSLPWAKASGFANDAGSEPTATGTTFNRNFEMIYRSNASRLRHWWFDQTGGTWNDGATFGPTNAVGTPGFVESHYGPGNFEVVTALSNGNMQHWWRDGGGWHPGPVFGNPPIVVHAEPLNEESQPDAEPETKDGIIITPPRPIFGNPIAEVGGSLIETTTGHLELVCLLRNGELQHWTRDDGGTWGWSAVTTFAAGCHGAPVMIEGQYARTDEFSSGNYELVVALTNGTLQHWWRDLSGVWRSSATFGTGIDKALTLVQSSFGFNLEVVARRQDGNMQHFWRDGSGWHDGVVVGPAL